MSYGQFCPIAKASEIISEKWSIIIIRELLAGSDTFNDLRKGIPLVSPTLLSKRLIELEDAKIVKKVETGKLKPKFCYKLTKAGTELGPILFQLGLWGNKWAVSRLNKEDYDPRLLVWDIKRNIPLDVFKNKDRYVVKIEFSGVPSKLVFWWLVIYKNEVDICYKNPGYDVQLSIRSHIKTLTDLWMGWTTLNREKRANKIVLDGTKRDVQLFPKWFKLNLFAREA